MGIWSRIFSRTGSNEKGRENNDLSRLTSMENVLSINF
jgi:hypothetical protein